MTMDKFAPGQSAELEAEVTEELTINRMGREGAEVLSTPSLLGLMEQCSIQASEPYLPDEYTTVGYAVDGMRHMAPTPIGARVRVRSVLTEVDRNRLTFSIEAFEGEKKIGVAVHKRAVISKEEGA
jgi:fluoroacetyl-CoA thioesterase